MPLSPQIVITPETVPTKNFDITAVAYTSSTATYTAAGHTFSVNDIVLISGIAPDGYNGPFTVTAITTNTFTVANATNAAVTDGIGNAFWADPTEFDFTNYDAAYATDNNDVNDLINTNASVSAAYAKAVQAQADAATAIANAGDAYNQAVAANTAANTAQTTANGKNKVVYSQTTPGATPNVAGDIWFQYGTSGVNNGRIIAQFMGNGGTSWTQTTVSGLVIANIDAGNITTGTLAVGVGITGTSGNFSVNAVTGALVATSAVITGKIIATDSTFTGTVTATDGTFTGTIYAKSGYIGDVTTGWNFSASGYMYSNDFGTILYPKSSQSPYALITNRGIDCSTLQVDSTSSTAFTLSGGMTVNGVATIDRISIVTYGGIVGGYGINTDWSPNSDNSFALGQATSAGAGANRRWQRLYSNNTTISTSDASKKTDVTVSPLGLDFINALRPVAYKWIEGSSQLVLDADGNPIVESYDALGKPVFQMQSIPGKRTHYGLIAQEVKSALDAANVGDFAGWVQDDISDPASTQSLSYEQFIAPLIKAVQELTARVSILEGK